MSFLALLIVAIAAPHGSVADAKSAVRALESRYEHARTLKATFFERYSDGNGAAQSESGTVYFSRPGRMRWDYESPEEKLFLVDGTNVWFYVPADRTASRAKMKESSDWRTPIALLAGRPISRAYAATLRSSMRLQSLPGKWRIAGRAGRQYCFALHAHEIALTNHLTQPTASAKCSWKPIAGPPRPRSAARGGKYRNRIPLRQLGGKHPHSRSPISLSTPARRCSCRRSNARRRHPLAANQGQPSHPFPNPIYLPSFPS